MKIEYPSQDTVNEEAATVRRTLWFSSPPVSDFLKNAVRVVTVLAALWGILYSVVSGLENRLNNRIDSVESGLHGRIDSVESGLHGRIDGLERGMAEGFRQSGARMDRMDGRLDRMDGRLDRIESDIDAIERHLYRISPAIEDKASPGVITPAVATPDALVSSTADTGAEITASAPSLEER